MNEWIAEHLHRGPVGWGVLLSVGTLILFSVFSVAIIVQCASSLRTLRRREDEQYEKMRQSLAQGKIVIPPNNAAFSAQAVENALSHAASSEVQKEAALQHLALLENEIAPGLSFLGTVASTAPYVGLFGTVLGILDAFNRIAASKQTSADIVAAPIAEALTATAIGLGVAIPAVMAYNYLGGKVNLLAQRIEYNALDLLTRAETAREDVATR